MWSIILYGMTYSIVGETGNAADRLRESDSLLRFAYNHARQHWHESIGGAIDDIVPFAGIIHLTEAAATPLIFCII